MRAPLVLCYHRVQPAGVDGGILPWQRARGMVVDAPVLAAQLESLRSRFRVVSLAEAIAGLDRGADPRGTCLLTFDDGYADFTAHALPILEAAGLPCALFPVMTCALDPAESMPVDRLYRLLSSPRAAEALSPGERHDCALGEWKRSFLRLAPAGQEAMLASLRRELGLEIEPPADANDRMLSAAELAALPANVTLGSHGVRHHLATTLDAASLHETLAISRTWLARLRGRPEDTLALAWPNGTHGAREAAAAEGAGYRLAFGVGPARIEGPFGVPRLVVPNDPAALDRLSDLEGCP